MPIAIYVRNFAYFALVLIYMYVKYIQGVCDCEIVPINFKHEFIYFYIKIFNWTWMLQWYSLRKYHLSKNTLYYKKKKKNLPQKFWRLIIIEFWLLAWIQVTNADVSLHSFTYPYILYMHTLHGNKVHYSYSKKKKRVAFYPSAHNIILQWMRAVERNLHSKHR